MEVIKLYIKDHTSSTCPNPLWRLLQTGAACLSFVLSALYLYCSLLSAFFLVSLSPAVELSDHVMRVEEGKNRQKRTDAIVHCTSHITTRGVQGERRRGERSRSSKPRRGREERAERDRGEKGATWQIDALVILLFWFFFLLHIYAPDLLDILEAAMSQLQSARAGG